MCPLQLNPLGQDESDSDDDDDDGDDDGNGGGGREAGRGRVAPGAARDEGRLGPAKR